MFHRFACVFLIFTLWLASATLAQPPAENLQDACVADYAPETDYFPHKTTFTTAQNVDVTYFNHYKVVTVLDAFDDAQPFTYVLVQCGTPYPDSADFPAGTQFIEVPAGPIITMSTTQLPHLSALGLLDNLVGVDSFFYINNLDVMAMIEEGQLVEVGFGSGVNVEVVLATESDIVMTYGFNPDFDAHPVLIAAGVFTALNAEWREASPLGRAEWIKYTALFYNAEAEANEAYDAIANQYSEARALAETIPVEERPTVLWNAFSLFDNGWDIPGAATYSGQLITDAGGIIALGEQALTTSARFSLEVIYDGALDADIWMPGLFGVGTLDDVLSQDPRYADFAAVANGNVWNNDLSVNANGGNNFYELGVTNPHLILLDLVAIFHPQLLPDHEFIFYRRLQPAQ